MYFSLEVRACVLSRVQLFVTLWTVACQAPLFMEFSRQDYWSELPFPPPGDLPDPGIKPVSPLSPALADGFLTTAPLGKPLRNPGAGKSVTLLNASSKTHKLVLCSPELGRYGYNLYIVELPLWLSW